MSTSIAGGHGIDLIIPESLIEVIEISPDHHSININEDIDGVELRKSAPGKLKFTGEGLNDSRILIDHFLSGETGKIAIDFENKKVNGLSISDLSGQNMKKNLDLRFFSEVTNLALEPPKKGDDYVSFAGDGTKIRNNKIDLGKGDDTISFAGKLEIKGQNKITLGKGSDTVKIEDLVTGNSGSLEILDFGSNDLIVINDQRQITYEDLRNGINFQLPNYLNIGGYSSGPVALDYVVQKEIVKGDVIYGIDFGDIPSELVSDSDSDIATEYPLTSFTIGSVTIDGGESVSPSIAGISRNSFGAIKLDTTVDAFKGLLPEDIAIAKADFTVTDTFGQADGGSIVFQIKGSEDANNIRMESKDLSNDSIFATSAAFALLKRDGTITTWGDEGFGGDSGDVKDQLVNIKAIYSTNSAFAALAKNGSVITWGNPAGGGDSSLVSNQLDANVHHIAANKSAFVAQKTDGSIVAWGDPRYGGELPLGVSNLENISLIMPSDYAFTALTADSNIISWGDINALIDASASAAAWNDDLVDVDGDGIVNALSDGLIIATTALAIEVVAGRSALSAPFDQNVITELVNPYGARAEGEQLKSELKGLVSSKMLDRNENKMLDIQDAEHFIRNALGTFPGLAPASNLFNDPTSLIGLEDQLSSIDDNLFFE